MYSFVSLRMILKMMGRGPWQSSMRTGCVSFLTGTSWMAMITSPFRKPWPAQLLERTVIDSMIPPPSSAKLRPMQIPRGPQQLAAPTGIVKMFGLHMAGWSRSARATLQNDRGGHRPPLPRKRQLQRDLLAMAIIWNELGNERTNW